MKILFLTVFLFFLLLCLYFYCIMPRLSRKKQVKTFMRRPFAHRGLFTKDQSIPENSMAAFANAVKYGYGIELDIQLTKDNQVVVFHDHTLSRMCGIDLPVCQLTYQELQKFSLAGTSERIPLFQDVLKLVNGKVPLLVEIKLPTFRTNTCRLADLLLQDYSGQYCVESFNPLALRWYKKHRRDVVRGQLSANLTKPVAEGGFILCFLVKHLLLNFIGRPDFIAYCYKDTLNVSYLLNKRLLHTPTFAWTLRSEAAFEKYYSKFDSIIFDGFLPFHKHNYCSLVSRKQ